MNPFERYPHAGRVLLGKPRDIGTRFQAAVVAIAAIGFVVVLSALWNPQPSSAGEPWPPFVMTFKETARGLGLNGAMGTQRLRLEYTDRRHWRLTEIEHGALPSAAGSSWTFAGDRVIVHNAVRGVDSVTPYGPTEETVPTNWLVPGKTFWMAQRPTYKVTKIANGLAVLGHDELITTAPSAPGTPPITVAPRTFHEEITYREADGIPTGLVETLDGVVTRRIDVESFSLTRP